MARLARLQGALSADEPGTRELEHLARNPSYQRQRALIMAGSTPAMAVAQVYGDKSREGQSPFAIAAGNRFEQQLFDSGAARLLRLYRSRDQLSIEECRVIIIPDLAPERSPAAMGRRRAATTRLLRMKLNQDPMAPNLIIKPRLTVTLLGIEHEIEPDVLVAADSEAFYRLVEVKSYADREGKTDPADIRSVFRQAAVGLIGLRQFLDRDRVADAERLVPAIGDLVFKVPGSFRPRLQAMRLRSEIDLIERALNEAPRNLDELEALMETIGPNATLDRQEVLDRIPNNYQETCREFCALAPRCKQQALADADPIVLGSTAREELAAAGSIGRVLDLLRNRGAPPRTPEERALKEQLQLADREYRRAVRS